MILVLDMLASTLSAIFCGVICYGSFNDLRTEHELENQRIIAVVSGILTGFATFALASRAFANLMILAG